MHKICYNIIIKGGFIMKFRIKDDDGKEFEVEEIEEMKKDSEEEIEKKEKEEVKDDALTAEEIASLKQLAAVSSDLLKLLKVEEKEHANDEDEEKAKEEVIDTDEHDPLKANDSKGSFGSIEKKEKKNVNEYARQLEIENSWQNRFKGGNK
jgi:hypothetical protein